MNCAELLFDQDHGDPNRMAVQVLTARDPRGRQHRASFADIHRIAARTQTVLRDHGLVPGDTVLVVDQLAPRLFGSIAGMLASGFGVMLVEPWLPPGELELIIDRIRPKVLWTHWLGRVWGLRCRAVRRIPHWISAAQALGSTTRSRPDVVDLAPSHPGISTFTTGTTGTPKGSVRHHQLLHDQNRLIADAVDLGRFERPDLSVFANLVLGNLAMGRGSLVVPPSWPSSIWTAIAQLPAHERPATLSCGPAFVNHSLAGRRLERLPLESIHVGGALTDLETFEAGLSLQPNAAWVHVYGSSEAEPVALCDVRTAVERSRERGHFQTLALGPPIPQIRSEIDADETWVTGIHVCPLYAGDEAANAANKRLDAQGAVWHRMGDRIRADAQGWWYSGRSGQCLDDFELEQAIYSEFQTSRCFVHPLASGERVLYGERVHELRPRIAARFPAISQVVEGPLVRDRRHRARLDRTSSIQRGAPWLS